VGDHQLLSRHSRESGIPLVVEGSGTPALAGVTQCGIRVIGEAEWVRIVAEA
jgi:hypothetical protein